MSVKRAASVAHQSGEARVTAIIGGTTPETLLAWGANQLIYPAGLTAGERETYLTRSSWFNGQGTPVRNVLLLESRLKSESLAVAQHLLTLSHDFDLADADTLIQKARQGAEGQIRVGEAQYRAVLVAPSDFWPEDALDILLNYIKDAGRVIFLGRQPLSIQRLLFRTGVVRVSEAQEDIERGLSYAVVQDFHATRVDSTEAVAGILYQHRTDARRHYYFVVNAADHEVSVRLSFGGHGTIEEWDLWTGQIKPLATANATIPAGGSVAIVVGK